MVRDDILSDSERPTSCSVLGAGENLNRADAETTNYIYALRTIMPALASACVVFERLAPCLGLTRTWCWISTTWFRKMKTCKSRNARPLLAVRHTNPGE